jgi:hypothetical protein
MSRLEAAGKGIVLFHDPRPSTAAMMPEFLRALKTRGFRLVHIVPGDGPTPIVHAKPGWTSATEAIIAKTLGPKGLRSEPTPIVHAKPGWTSATEAIIAKTLGPKGLRSEPQEEGRGVKSR